MAEDDKELFASAFQDEAPEPDKVETPEPEQQERPRDEQGRFAPKAREESAEPAKTEPEKPEPKQSEGIPSWRLKEEAEARRAAEERASRVERELAEIRQQLARQEKKAEPEQPAPEPWDTGYTEYVLAQATAKLEERYSQALLSLAKETAIARHTEEVVSAAEKAFIEAAQNRTLDQADFHRVMNAPNRYAAAVEWHKRQQVMNTVGPDPNAWLEKQLEERLKDPAYQAQLLERIRGTAQQESQQRPLTQLPPSLNRATRASPSAEDDDESDAGLLKSALRR